MKYRKVGNDTIIEVKAIKKDFFLNLAGEELYNKIKASPVIVIVKVNVKIELYIAKI
jgi:hypothetical protein